MNNFGQIKLGDFGISKNLKTLGLASTFIGSTYYLAPEIIDDENYSFEADIWALGVTFYEFMNLQKPFRAKYPAVYFEIQKKEVEEINNIYSTDFRNLIYEMLNKDPKKRPKADDILNKQFIKNRINDFICSKKCVNINNNNSNKYKYEIGLDKILFNKKFRIINKDEKLKFNNLKFKFNETNKSNLNSKNINIDEHKNNMDDSYKYDMNRQINIYNSILSGVKSDEEIEKENNILL